VLQGTICLGDRVPPRISTTTWANCRGHPEVAATAELAAGVADEFAAGVADEFAAGVADSEPGAAVLPGLTGSGPRSMLVLRAPPGSGGCPLLRGSAPARSRRSGQAAP
jgi:hypothetical protein